MKAFVARNPVVVAGPIGIALGVILAGGLIFVALQIYLAISFGGDSGVDGSGRGMGD